MAPLIGILVKHLLAVANRPGLVSAAMDRIVSLLSLAVLVFAVSLSHAALPAEVYWHRILPRSPMPRVIVELLHAKGGNVVVISAYPKYYPRQTSLGPTEPQFPRTYFFQEKDLHPGAGMNPGLGLTRTLSGAAFIPRAQADDIPFSSDKLPEILRRLNVPPNSELAKEVKETLSKCEAAALKGEHKYCATSLESMVDFVLSELQTDDVRAMATTVYGDKQASREQRYTVAPSGVRRTPGTKLVTCHPEAYPHTMYYCHLTRATKAFLVTLVGADGTTVEAVAACHSDTSGWNPAIFKVLGLKRGTPICHFLPQDHLVWTPAQ